MEGEEVGALLALDVDDLDELAGADLVGESGGGVDADVEARFGERGRQLLLVVRASRGSSNLDQDLGRGWRTVDDAAGRSGDDYGDGALSTEGLGRAGRRRLAEELDRHGLARVEAA